MYKETPVRLSANFSQNTCRLEGSSTKFKVMKEKKNEKKKTNKKPLIPIKAVTQTWRWDSVKPTQKISVALSQLYKKY